MYDCHVDLSDQTKKWNASKTAAVKSPSSFGEEFDKFSFIPRSVPAQESYTVKI